MTTETTVLLDAAFATYPDATDAPSGYFCTTERITNEFGLHAIVFQKVGTKEYILAFRGTEMNQTNDWITNANLGWPQYERSRDDIQRVLTALLNDGGQVTTTGHSLGGALAQFAVYDLAKEAKLNGQDEILSQVSLTTWNALGGVWGLERNGGYDPTIAAGVKATHYFREDDLVARIGKGHVGGELLRLEDPAGLTTGIIPAHMKEEISESLRAGTITSALPSYLQLNEDSQQVIGDLMMGFFKLGSEGDQLAGLKLVASAQERAKADAEEPLIQDLGLLAGTALFQELRVLHRDGSPQLKLMIDHVLPGRPMMTYWIGEQFIAGMLKSISVAWPQLQQQGEQLIRRTIESFLEMGKAMIANWGAGGELQTWGLQQQLMLGTEGITGARLAESYLPGRPDLAASQSIFEGRLDRVAPFYCPLVLDLGGDGLSTLALADAGVRFDLDADGVREACGWIGPSEALLVRDLNGDGQINSGLELFGDHTQLANGQRAAHGFAALAELDGNGDGLIDGRDAGWSELGLWRDGDSDGDLDPGEWLGLAEADVTALDLAFSSGGGPDAQGNELRLMGHYRHGNGEHRLLVDVWLASDPETAAETPPLASASVTTAVSGTEVGIDNLPPSLLRLPDLGGMGRVKGLRDSLQADSSGRLAQRLDAWLAADSATRPTLIPDILYLWAGVADQPATPIGGLSDRRLLATLHAFSNDQFVTRNWDLSSPSNLELLRRTFEDLCSWVGNLLNSRELLSPLWSRAIRVGADGLAHVDGPSLDLALRDQWQRSPGDEQLIAVGQTLHSHPLVSDVLLTAMRERAMDQLSQPDRRLWLLLLPQPRASALQGGWRWSQAEAELLELGPGDDTLDAGDGNDVLIGSAGADRPRGGGGDDVILAGDGDDSIETSAGNDTICAGRGNDSIAVGHGQGLIVFNPGDGQDTITTTQLAASHPAAAQGFTLRFNGSHKAETIQIRRLQRNLMISFAGSNDQLTLAEYFKPPSPWDASEQVNSLRQISFADGQRWDYRQLMQQAIRSSDGNDDLQGCEFDETISGAAGDDNLHGWDGHDLLLGDNGSDTLQGGSGSNTIIGGKGDDRLIAEEGINAIIYTLGDGMDTLSGLSWTAHNELFLGQGISTNDVTISRSGDDLLLTVGDPSSGIRISSVFNRNHFLEEIPILRRVLFEDGSSWSWQMLKDSFLRGNDANNQITGFSNHDTLWGEGGHDLLYGGEGNDLVLGGSGNDTLWGDAGSDRLEGGEGNDVLVCYRLGGEDTLSGGSGTNLISYDRGDVLLSANPDGITPGINTLTFNAVFPENVILGRQGNTLLLTCSGYGMPGSSTIKVEDFFRDFTVLNRWNPLQAISFGSLGRWDIRSVAARFPNAFMGSSSANKLNGRDSDDWLDGMEANDLLQGLAGHDTLQGGSGNDTLSGGLGNDLLLGSDGQDTASWAGITTSVRLDLSLQGPQDSGAGLDTLLGIEHLLGGSSHDRLLGDDSANRLEGGDGDDTLDGGGGNDTLSGGNHLGGDSASYARAAAAVTVNLALTAAQNTGGAGSDLLSGLEHLIGSAHGDSLSGNASANRLEGGGGNDTLQGGAGVDTLVGGEGADLFRVANPAEAGNGSGSRDWILDFGTEDRLDLSAIDARSDQSGNQAFVWIGGAAFTALGQIRYTRLSNGNGLLEGNCSGSLAADFQLELSGAPDLAGGAALLL